jgi:uncharacterized protein DUF6328
VHEERDDERLNRELIELLNELRVALPGVQVLFGFLLTVPFTQRFERLSDGTVDIYFVAVLASVTASILLIAPAAHHRLRFRMGSKEQMIRVATVSALLGTGALAVALAAAAYVVAEMVYGSGAAQVTGACVAGGAGLVWFVVPLFYRRESSVSDRGR